MVQITINSVNGMEQRQLLVFFILLFSAWTCHWNVISLVLFVTFVNTTKLAPVANPAMHTSLVETSSGEKMECTLVYFGQCEVAKLKNCAFSGCKTNLGLMVFCKIGFLSAISAVSSGHGKYFTHLRKCLISVFNVIVVGIDHNLRRCTISEIFECHMIDDIMKAKCL